MKNMSKFKDEVLKEYPRMQIETKFRFSCNPSVSCFNKCCNDVNIFLTPYDIIRLRKRLGITSTEFLDKYTILPIDENLRHPIVMLQMLPDELNCHFVDKNGCTVYEDRPWSCRMFPVGAAMPNEAEKSDEFYFLINEEVCKGFEAGNDWTVEEWMNDQGVKDYIELGEMFKEISLHEYFVKGKYIEPVKLEMFYMVCYDIDKFREFVYESTFLKRFNIGKELIEKMKTNDVELLKFGFKWLRFSLFGEKTMELRENYMKKIN